MRKTLALILALAMLLALAACGSSPAPAASQPQASSTQSNDTQTATADPAPASTSVETYQMSVSTGGVTGMYYTTLAPICDYINSSTDAIRVVPATSGGSSENLNNVLSGVCDLGCVYNNAIPGGYESNNGLRFVGPTTKCSPLQFVVRADSDIYKPEDLIGKDVALGQAGSGARAWAVQFFTWLGIYDKFTEVPLGNEDLTTALGDGDVVLITVAGLAPSARVSEAAASYDIRILDLTEYLDDFIGEYPYFERYTIEPGIYENVEDSATTFGLATSIVCMEDLDFDALYTFMTLAYGEKAQELAMTTNPNGPDHNPENPLANMTIPIHPAAEKYWTEKGYEIPDI